MKCKDQSVEWLSNYLYFVARKYPYVFMDLLNSYILDKKDIQIMIERYINHKTLDEISSIVFLETRQVANRKQKALLTLLGCQLQ